MASAMAAQAANAHDEVEESAFIDITELQKLGINAADISKLKSR